MNNPSPQEVEVKNCPRCGVESQICPSLRYENDPRVFIQCMAVACQLESPILMEAEALAWWSGLSRAHPRTLGR